MFSVNIYNVVFIMLLLSYLAVCVKKGRLQMGEVALKIS